MCLYTRVHTCCRICLCMETWGRGCACVTWVDLRAWPHTEVYMNVVTAVRVPVLRGVRAGEWAHV